MPSLRVVRAAMEPKKPVPIDRIAVAAAAAAAAVVVVAAAAAPAQALHRHDCEDTALVHHAGNEYYPRGCVVGALHVAWQSTTQRQRSEEHFLAVSSVSL